MQVAPCVEAASGGCTNQNVADWFNNTAQLASQGQPANSAGEISFVLGGPKNHGPGLWNWDHKDFSPRIAVAWAPDTGDGWVSKILGKKDQFSIRGGYSITYDHFGIPIVNSFDQHGSFGLSTDLGNPAGVVTVAGRSPLYLPHSGSIRPVLPARAVPDSERTGLLVRPTPAGRFPLHSKQHRLRHQLGARPDFEDPLRARLQFLALAPNHARIPRSRLPMWAASAGVCPCRSIWPCPRILTDPSSKTTYFQAATMLSKAAAESARTSSQIQPIPFFENIFPAWAGAIRVTCKPIGGDCAGRQLPRESHGHAKHLRTLELLPAQRNLLSVPAGSARLHHWHCRYFRTARTVPYSFFHDQFASLYAWRNIGTSDYNALQVTYNVRWGANLQGQFNYTFSKSFDEASAAERVGPYEGTGGTGDDLNGGGIVINSWDPLSLRGLSDFNAFHQINANLVYHLPFGKGQRFAENAGPLLNALVGGWHVSGIFRWTSGFPITIDNGFTWATNWNIEGDAEPNGPAPVASNPKNAVVNGVGIGPDIFADPAAGGGGFPPRVAGRIRRSQ